MTPPMLTADQEAAFAQLYHLATGEARRLVATPRAADFDRDDATQVGALALCDAIRSHDATRGPLKPYARLAVRRAIIDAFRHHCGREATSGRRRLSSAGPLGDDVGRADRDMEASEVADSVRSALDWFAPVERRIVELYFIAEMKLEEVAAEVGMSISSVCQIKNGAIETLRAEAASRPSWWRLASRSGRYKPAGAGGGVRVRVNRGEGRRDDGMGDYSARAVGRVGDVAGGQLADRLEEAA